MTDGGFRLVAAQGELPIMMPNLMRPIRTPPGDVGDVLDAASALGIREFDLFRNADRWWHGRLRSEKSLERIFVAYMFGGVAPAWVRQYCRAVLAENAAGRLDPMQFGVTPSGGARSRTPGDYRYFVAAIVSAVALYAMLLVHVSTAPQTSNRMSCQGGGAGLVAIETVAHLVGRGRPPPPCGDMAADPPTNDQR